MRWLSFCGLIDGADGALRRSELVAIVRRLAPRPTARDVNAACNDFRARTTSRRRARFWRTTSGATRAGAHHTSSANMKNNPPLATSATEPRGMLSAGAPRARLPFSRYCVSRALLTTSDPCASHSPHPCPRQQIERLLAIHAERLGCGGRAFIPDPDPSDASASSMESNFPLFLSLHYISVFLPFDRTFSCSLKT